MKEPRIPTLDGWRAIAITLVLIDHFTPGFPYHRGGKWLEIIGNHGVNIFFVLSGYLITSKLLEERSISLGRFYVRRFFRLMPAAWTYLAFVALIQLLHWRDALACVFFYRNFYDAPHGGVTAHFWSLSAEEEFYLVWPTILLLLGRRAWMFAVLVVSALSVWRFFPDHAYALISNCHQVPLMVGCALAFAPKKLLPGHGWILIVAVLGIVVCLRFEHALDTPIWESAMVGFALWSTSLGTFPLAGRILDHPILATIGALSYSLYIWQEPVSLLGPHTWALAPVRFVVAGLLGLMSYHLLETPGIRYGRKLLAKHVEPANPVVA